MFDGGPARGEALRDHNMRIKILLTRLTALDKVANARLLIRSMVLVARKTTFAATVNATYKLVLKHQGNSCQVKVAEE